MSFFNFDDELKALDKSTLKLCKEQFEKIDEIASFNQEKVLSAFIENKVSEQHLGISTGYGYGDIGRDTLDKVLADCFGCEDAIIRHSFASGTHTLAVALFGILRPSDKVLCIMGRPYDTITGVFGIDEKTDGSLADFGVTYNQVDLKSDGTVDLDKAKEVLQKDYYKMAYIQRSRGYSLRPSLTIDDIELICKEIKSVSPDTVIMVDNCYGEFVEKKEPTQVGADLMAGSLIKNLGGGIAPTGGYIAGKEKYVEMCSYRMTCAGVGREVGATLGHNRELYMGLFSAPHVVGQALKTAVYAAALFQQIGYDVTPKFDEKRGDIIECLLLKNSQSLISYCKGIQSGSPVDSFVSPEPWDMPGYTDKVIMAAGTFTLGASIELSADAPLREPYAVWMQGGINFESAKIGVLLALKKIKDDGNLIS